MQGRAPQVLVAHSLVGVKFARAMVLVLLLAAACTPLSLAQARKPTARPKAAAPAKAAPVKRPCASFDDAWSMGGTWKAEFEPDVESSKIMTNADRLRVLKDTNVYAELLHQALGNIEGHDAVWYRSIGGQLYHDGPAKYQVNVPLFRHDCEGGFVTREGEHSEAAAITVNSTWYMSGADAFYSIGGKKYYTFASPIGEIHGFPAYQTDYAGIAHTTSWIVVVSKPGKKPFHLATRRELLDSLRAQAEAEQAAFLAQTAKMVPIRSPEEQKADHDKELALFLKGAKDAAQRQHWTERFEHDYRTDEQKLEDLRAKMNKERGKTLANLDKLIAAQTPEQMEMPAMSHPSAITHVWADFKFLPTHEETCGKDVCGENFGRPFGIPNVDYYNAALTPGRPQFACVVFEWSNGAEDLYKKRIDPRLAKIRDEFFAKFDFDKLVSMLEN